MEEGEFTPSTLNQNAVHFNSIELRIYLRSTLVVRRSSHSCCHCYNALPQRENINRYDWNRIKVTNGCPLHESKYKPLYMSLRYHTSNKSILRTPDPELSFNCQSCSLSSPALNPASCFMIANIKL